jgi:hypothetical protein
VNGWLAAAITAATGSQEYGALWGGIAGPAAEELSFSIRTVLRRQDKKIARMLEAAGELGELEPKALVAECLADDAKVELLVRATEAAARSTSDAKVRILAQLLHTGALSTDSAQVDEHLVAIDAISALDAPHIRLLGLLQDPSGEKYATDELDEELRYA